MPTYETYSTSLTHHGIKGQRWGIRRFQNDDGSLTPEGRERYGVEAVRSTALAISKHQTGKGDSTGANYDSELSKIIKENKDYKAAYKKACTEAEKIHASAIAEYKENVTRKRAELDAQGLWDSDPIEADRQMVKAFSKQRTALENKIDKTASQLVGKTYVSESDFISRMASAMAKDISYDKDKIEDFMHLQFASDKASSLYRMDLYDKNFSYNEVANMPWMFDMQRKYGGEYVPKYMLYSS